MSDLRHRVQVCVPFTWLREELLDHFTRQRLNPEIGIDAAAIERCSPQDFARVADVLHRHGLTVTLHAPFVDLLDCGHLSAFGRAPLEQWLDELGALIGQLHLHDNWGHKDDHLPIGQGRIDFVRLFALLKAERSSPPVVTLEIHRPHDVWSSLEFLERLWPWPA